MAAGVHYVNLGWRDMDVPNLGKMMDLVQVVDSHLRDGGRIAVHCHAGLGRTGLAIACSLVYTRGVDALQAVQMVRAHRPGTLQTRKQELFVHVFEQYLAYLRCEIELSTVE